MRLKPGTPQCKPELAFAVMPQFPLRAVVVGGDGWAFGPVIKSGGFLAKYILDFLNARIIAGGAGQKLSEGRKNVALGFVKMGLSWIDSRLLQKSVQDAQEDRCD
jgi:hypothetical protein